MKKYRLKKDLPTLKVGQECWLNNGGLYTEQLRGDRVNNPHTVYKGSILLYAKYELEKFPNILTDWFEEIPEQPRTVDDLKIGDECYQICGTIVYRCKWDDSDGLRLRRDIGDITLTREEAEKRLARRRAKVILERDTKRFKPSKENNWEYWGVYYDPRLNEGLDVTSNFGFDGTLPFATQEDAEASIKAHEKEWKTYLGVEE